MVFLFSASSLNKNMKENKTWKKQPKNEQMKQNKEIDKMNIKKLE